MILLFFYSPAEGNYTDYTYDSRGNVTVMTDVAKPGSGLPNHVVTADYDAVCNNPKTCNQPNYVIDGGARTDFTYDPNHGGVLTVTGPAGANGVRPQTRYGYTQLYAWYLNSAGALVQAPTPVWRLTSTSTCATQASCAGTSDEITTTIAYGTSGTANNLLPTSVTTGGNGVYATNSYTYNIYGDLKTVDGPLAGAVDTVRNRFDTQRELVGRIELDPDGIGDSGRPSRATRITYDGDGKPTLIESGSVASQSDTDWQQFSTLNQLSIGYNLAGGKFLRPSGRRRDPGAQAIQL